jgi:hypothetical protein
VLLAPLVPSMTPYASTLLDHIASAGAELDWVLAEFPAGWLHRRIGDEWSVHENLSHLRDVEVRAYAPRIAALAGADGVSWTDFNGQAWHREHYNPGEPLQGILVEFHEQRAASVATLRGLTPAQWEHSGQHEGEGAVTMEYLAERLHWHTFEHITQAVGKRQMLAVAK